MVCFSAALKGLNDNLCYLCNRICIEKYSEWKIGTHRYWFLCMHTIIGMNFNLVDFFPCFKHWQIAYIQGAHDVEFRIHHLFCYLYGRQIKDKSCKYVFIPVNVCVYVCACVSGVCERERDSFTKCKCKII